MLVEVFGQANAVLPGESEPDVVPGVDRGRPGIIDSAGVVAGGDSRFVLGHQAPRLAGEEFPAIVKLGLAPRLAETESVAIRLSGCGGHASREKVTGDVAGKRYIVQTPIDVHSGSRLTSGTEELRQGALRSSGHGEAVERSGYVSSQLSRPPHESSFHESARCDRDSFEVNRDRAVHGVWRGVRRGILRVLCEARRGPWLHCRACISFRQLPRNGLSWGCVGLGRGCCTRLLQLPCLLAL